MFYHWRFSIFFVSHFYFFIFIFFHFPHFHLLSCIISRSLPLIPSCKYCLSNFILCRLCTVGVFSFFSYDQLSFKLCLRQSNIASDKCFWQHQQLSLSLCMYVCVLNGGGMLSWVSVCVCVTLCVCVCACITSAWLRSARLDRERENNNERGRAVLACGLRTDCCRLVAVLRWWPWFGPPSRKWWSSFTGSRGWPSHHRATRNSARYVDSPTERERERESLVLTF